MNIIFNYSPNFDTKKRKKEEIKFLIFHYTGMKSEVEAINKLTNNTSKVSSHYFIKNNGQILQLVPDLYIAWHAGISGWKKFKSLNKYSIGIEISNPGHGSKYKKFNKEQIKSVIKLSKLLIKRYKIKSKFILGHSDISPNRKKDPGEKFPWEYISKKNIGYWHNLNSKRLLINRGKKIEKLGKSIFIKNLKLIGYSVYKNSKKLNYIKLLTKAFQRRFRPTLVNGLIDKECLILSNYFVKKFK